MHNRFPHILSPSSDYRHSQAAQGQPARLRGAAPLPLDETLELSRRLSTLWAEEKLTSAWSIDASHAHISVYPTGKRKLFAVDEPFYQALADSGCDVRDFIGHRADGAGFISPTFVMGVAHQATAYHEEAERARAAHEHPLAALDWDLGPFTPNLPALIVPHFQVGVS